MRTRKAEVANSSGAFQPGAPSSKQRHSGAFLSVAPGGRKRRRPRAQAAGRSAVQMQMRVASASPRRKHMQYNHADTCASVPLAQGERGGSAPCAGRTWWKCSAYTTEGWRLLQLREFARGGSQGAPLHLLQRWLLSLMVGRISWCVTVPQLCSFPNSCPNSYAIN